MPRFDTAHMIFYYRFHSLSGSSDSVNGDLQFLWT